MILPYDVSSSYFVYSFFLMKYFILCIHVCTGRKMGVDDDDTKAAAKIDGGYMFISSFFTAMLSFGMDAVQAMGFVGIACLPLSLAVVDLSSAEKIFGMSPEGWAVLVAVFVGASAYGMLN